MRVCARARAELGWMHVRVCVCGCMSENLCLRACSLSNPACNTPPCCHCRLSLRYIFRHYLTNGTMFRKKKLFEIKCVFDFSAGFIWNISHPKKNSPRNCHKCENVFIWSTLYSRQIIMKLEFSREIFEKKSSNFITIRPVRAELFHAYRQTDGSTWRS